MSTYTIIAGVNGVGKSSLTGVLKNSDSDIGFVIDIDKIAFDENISNIEAGKKAISLINNFIEQGVSFTQETTLSGRNILKTVNLARSRGYEIIMYYVGLNSSEESISRIANRVKNGGHDISSEDVKRRFTKRFESIVNIVPYCDKVIFYDNNNGFAKVGEYTQQKGYICTTSKLPLWFDEFYNNFAVNQK